MVPVELSKLREAGYELIEADFQRQLKIAVTDCLERPGEKAVRKVVISFEVRPSPNERGVCEEVLLDVTIAPTLPKTNPMGTIVAVPHGKGNLLVTPGSPNEPAQHTFNELDQGDEHVA